MTTIDRPPSVLSHNWPHLPTYHISGHSVLVPHLWVLRRQMLECAVARGWIYNVTQHANTTHYPVRSLFFVFGTPFFVNRCPPPPPPPPKKNNFSQTQQHGRVPPRMHHDPNPKNLYEQRGNSKEYIWIPFLQKIVRKVASHENESLFLLIQWSTFSWMTRLASAYFGEENLPRDNSIIMRQKS